MADDYAPAIAPDDEEERQRMLAGGYTAPSPAAPPPASIASAPASPDLVPPAPAVPRIAEPKQPKWSDYAPPERHGWGKFGSIMATLTPTSNEIVNARPMRHAEQNYKAASAEYTQGEKEREEQTKEARQAPLTAAQTHEAEARAQSLENPPEKPSKAVIHETDQGIFMVDPETNRATPLTYQGKPLMPKQSPDANKLAGEIAAQVGEKPTAAEYAGKTYPSVAEAQAAWGKAAEGIKNREAAASGQARGEAFGSFRPVAVIDPDTGQLTYMFAGQAIKHGAAPAGPGATAMGKGQQMQEMHVAAGKARDAINNLDKSFTPDQIGKLTLAMHQDDPGVFRTEIETMLGTQQLTPAQQDFVVWISQLNERAMSLRNVAGMGQGSEDMRKAIRATLPGVKSGSKELALKQLDAFENQVSILEQGIPGVRNAKTAASGPAKFEVPKGAPAAPKEDGHKLKANGQVIAVSKGGQWVAPQ